jgi:hypothetical protein
MIVSVTRIAAHLLGGLILLAGCGPMAEAPADSESVYWSPPALAEDAGPIPDGRVVIGNMVDFMGSHDELAAEALLTYEAVQESGQKLHFDLLHRIALRKPDNRMVWVTLRDDGTTEKGWIAEGEFTMLKQPGNIYAQVDGPVAVPQIVEMLTGDYGIDVPFEDLVGGRAADLWLGEDVASIMYVGEAFIGGQWTDQVAIRKTGVDFEIWVAKGDAPYPAKIAAVFTETKGRPSFVFTFRKYSTVLPPSASLDLDIPDDAERVDIGPVVNH